jgi:hypothetical protein
VVLLTLSMMRLKVVLELEVAWRWSWKKLHKRPWGTIGLDESLPEAKKALERSCLASS